MGALQDIASKPLPGGTPEQNRDTRARAWIFAFECYRKKEGSRPGAPDAGKEINDDFAESFIPK